MSDLFERLKTALADQYAIERELGAGGMATVYLARDVKHDRQVAVKVLKRIWSRRSAPSGSFRRSSSRPNSNIPTS